MCGQMYCKACDEPIVRAWASGRIHERPQFGDNAQREVAMFERQQNFTRLLVTGNIEFLRWPEVTLLLKSLGASKSVVARVVTPAPLPTYLVVPVKGMSGQKKRRQQRARAKWHTEMFGAGYRAALKNLRLKLQIEAEDMEQMALAA